MLTRSVARPRMPAEEKKKGFGSFSWQPKLWLLLIVLAFHGTTALSVGKNNNMQLPYQLYLFSLQASTEDNFSVPTRNVWKWKDTVLGDGRDFFVPRPKTLLALQRYLMQCVDKEENDGVEMDVTGCIEECIILSNCARLEIVFLTTLPAKAKADHQQAWLTTHLSRRLVAQTQSFGQDANHQLWNSLFPLDRPSNIDLSIQPKARDESRLLWTCLTTPDTICRHLCTVAAGMADRPSRPNRPVAFRPFSSRDAHILLQLKRTCTTFESDCPRLITLIQTALRAGKAARTVSKVPALEELRAYGTGDTSYDSAPPQSVMERVKETALREAIEPAVQSFLEGLKADTAANQISALRQAALKLATHADEERWIKQQLHHPTMALRDGNDWIDVQEVLNGIEKELVHKRQSTLDPVC